MANTLGLQAKYKKHQLQFKFDAGTSRGVLRTKDTYFIEIWHPNTPSIKGYGEAGPLPKLSVDDVPQFECVLKEYTRGLNTQTIHWSEEGILDFCMQYINELYPSIRFAFEIALLDLFYGGKHKILPNRFYEKGEAIPINGLIWMGKVDFMKNQMEEKLNNGFDCIKLKIGALDFDQELTLLAEVRKMFSAKEITLRVDANGAFGTGEAMAKLKSLAKLDIHSIEQPIKAGQWNAMAKLCQESPLPIALDEELIGVNTWEDKKRLLETIRPAYIILKPTLLGGITATKAWITLAHELNIGWWVTSALESNIGLNAIAQFTSSCEVTVPQGLGTGQLYHNNIPSPLKVENGYIVYDSRMAWGKP